MIAEFACKFWYYVHNYFQVLRVDAINSRFVVGSFSIQWAWTNTDFITFSRPNMQYHITFVKLYYPWLYDRWFESFVQIRFAYKWYVIGNLEMCGMVIVVDVYNIFRENPLHSWKVSEKGVAYVVIPVSFRLPYWSCVCVFTSQTFLIKGLPFFMQTLKITRTV